MRFGAPLQNVTADDFKMPERVFQIGVAPRRIDILTSISGVQFDEAWPERKMVEVEGIAIPVIGRAHLVQNKKATGRPKDQADAAWLENAQER